MVPADIPGPLDGGSDGCGVRRRSDRGDRTPGPLLTADDLASFGLAWTMAGEGAAPMPQAPYGLLYPATLVPGWLLGFDDGGDVAWARTVNALCGA